MPIRKSATRGFHKHHAGGGKAFRQIAPGPRISTLNRNVAEMRFTIGAGIQIVDAHRDPSLFLANAVAMFDVIRVAPLRRAPASAYERMVLLPAHTCLG